MVAQVISNVVAEENSFTNYQKQRDEGVEALELMTDEPVLLVVGVDDVPHFIFRGQTIGGRHRDTMVTAGDQHSDACGGSRRTANFLEWGEGNTQHFPTTH